MPTAATRPQGLPEQGPAAATMQHGGQGVALAAAPTMQHGGPQGVPVAENRHSEERFIKPGSSSEPNCHLIASSPSSRLHKSSPC